MAVVQCFLVFIVLENAQFKLERPGGDPGLSSQLLLLLALGVGLIGVLVGGLRMLLGTIRMLLTLGMVAFAVMFSGGTVCLRSIFVVLGSFIVFVSGHEVPRWLRTPSRRQTRRTSNCSNEG
jgi:hypothetical protein